MTAQGDQNGALSFVELFLVVAEGVARVEEVKEYFEVFYGFSVVAVLVQAAP